MLDRFNDAITSLDAVFASDRACRALKCVLWSPSGFSFQGYYAVRLLGERK